MKTFAVPRATARALGLSLVMSLSPGWASATDGAGACNPDERLPVGIARLAARVVEAVADDFEGLSIRYRSGLLRDDADAVEHVAALARPADVMVTANRGTLASRLIPGFFTHAAAYFGSERQLRALGIWNHRSIRPLQAEIRAGKVVIQATERGVHLSTLESLLDTDRLLLARPGGADGLSPARRRQIVVALAASLGAPYDFGFDATTPDKLFCAELLQRAIPELSLPVTTIYGQRTIKPVVIAEAVVTRRSNLAFVTYIQGGEGGFERFSRADLRFDLAEARRAEERQANCSGAQDAIRPARDFWRPRD
jgi:hypothetical protein